MDGAEAPRHRPLVFDKMESLIKEMQDAETGVPVRSQKLFLTFIPSAFMGYDLVEWLMERFNLDESNNVEAINIANQLCQYGYIFPVNDSKNLVLKDDSSLYRFQSPYYWPWQAPRVAGSTTVPSLGPDNVEYAIYLVKRTLRNKQRHGLEEYELEALANLKKNLSAKWDFITMQAEEQVRLAKERKKGDKIVSDSQERAYWRVARPPPGMTSALEACPVPVRNRLAKPKPKTEQQLKEEIEVLKESLDRTRVKTSTALDALLAHCETFAPYDPWLTTALPSNPWVSDDTLYWQINSPLVEVPTEKRVQKWAISIEELVADPTGLQEFTNFLRKEYSHENIRFWTAVTDLHYSSSKQIPKKLEDIYEEFLKPGAPCEINIDGATSEKVAEGMRSGSRYAFDHAADHVFNLLLKKDCYPRFIRSDHFQRLLAEGKNVLQKKAKFFNFGGGQVKKKPGTSGAGGSSGGLARRRGSERSLSGSAHELAICSTQPTRSSDPTPPHSHSQSNLCDIRDPEDDNADVAPWESSPRDAIYEGTEGSSAPRRRQDSGSSSSEMSAMANERRRLPQQSTLDGGLRGANPPLRRLSAVEPRHLTPLVSPMDSPRVAPRPLPPGHAPSQPTPTISVSSAPDDSPPEESGAMEPPSVFASAAVTPTEPCAASPLRDCPSGAKDSARSSIVNFEGSERSRSESSEVCIRIGDDDKPLVRNTPSLDASNRDLSEIDDLVDSSRTVDDSMLSCVVENLPEESAPLVVQLTESRDSNVISPTIVVAVSEAEKTGALRKSESTNSSLNSTSTVPASSSKTLTETIDPREEKVLRRYHVAPLAVGEDVAIDDDDDVPSMPAQASPSKPTPVVVVSSTNRTENIAQKEDKPVTDTNVLERDNMESGKSQKNDVCPWEDENSCESDTPFVKTYATLGYL